MEMKGFVNAAILITATLIPMRTTILVGANIAIVTHSLKPSPTKNRLNQMTQAVRPMNCGDSIRASDLHFCGGQYDEAKDMVLSCHYSNRIPGNVCFVGSFHESGGLFGDNGPMVAACFFSSPPTRWSEPVIELTRLVRLDNIRVPLSRLISLSLKHLKSQGFDLIVSFADRTQGHEGYVYRASNWKYHGLRDPQNDGLIINGSFIPGRSCNEIYGSRSQDVIKTMLPDSTVEKHFDEGKHLYWYPLNKAGARKAERLDLKNIAWNKKGVANESTTP